MSLSVDCRSCVRRASPALLLTGWYAAIRRGGDVTQDTTTDFDIADWLRASRAAQGLPEQIEDEMIITRVLILAGLLGRPAKSPSRTQDGTPEDYPAEVARPLSPAQP
jgi:hypothetical protein